MQPLVGHDSLATGIFAVVFGGWVLFEIGLSSFKRPERGAKRRDGVSGLFVFLAIFVAFIIMESVAKAAPGAAMTTKPWIIFGAAIAVAFAGFALRLWAIRVLGRSFTAAIATSPGQTVVDSGPYRRIRHPSYTGALVTVLGAALTFTNWLSLVAFVPVFLAYCYRIMVEERALEGDLGGAYEEYRRRTRRMIPFVF